MNGEGYRPGLGRVAVAAASGNRDRCAASGLARDLGLPFVASDRQGDVEADLLLVVGEDGLCLRETLYRGAGPIGVDFLAGPGGYRRWSARSRRQPIALAVGLRRGPVTLVDATAGLARDAFLLACLGCTVLAIERSPALGAMIHDGIRRARAAGSASVRAALDRITLTVADARDVLTDMRGEAAPDVVYLDPMYPPKRKTALVKKEMRLCRRLVGDDPDAGELLTIARRVAGRRVVVKRHRHAPPLAPRPELRFTGKQVRYDVYLSNGQGRGQGRRRAGGRRHRDPGSP